MTWNEFKELVDEALLKKGYDGDVGIWYIDVSYPEKHRLEVGLEIEDGLFVETLE